MAPTGGHLRIVEQCHELGGRERCEDRGAELRAARQRALRRARGREMQRGAARRAGTERRGRRGFVVLRRARVRVGVGGLVDREPPRERLRACTRTRRRAPSRAGAAAAAARRRRRPTGSRNLWFAEQRPGRGVGACGALDRRDRAGRVPLQRLARALEGPALKDAFSPPRAPPRSRSRRPASPGLLASGGLGGGARGEGPGGDLEDFAVLSADVPTHKPTAQRTNRAAAAAALRPRGGGAHVHAVAMPAATEASPSTRPGPSRATVRTFWPAGSPSTASTWRRARPLSLCVQPLGRVAGWLLGRGAGGPRRG
jgi:hypothetical protein